MRLQRAFFRGTFLAGAILAVGLSGLSRADDRKPLIPDLKVEKYTLDNGLEVVLHEDHTTPVVGVNIWYKVGSANEKPGRTGFAHLFEHLMFQGSEHHDKEYFAPIEKLGANINGSTNTDRTNYFETLPSSGLELALWLESDRMGFLLPALTQQKLDNQRDVVKNERRQRVDNVPYGQSMEAMLKALFPENHPYHHSVIGSMADLSAASREDVSAFFRTYYSPNNASLCIAGDFRPDEAKKLVEKYFGPIPRGPKVEKLKPVAAKLEEDKHVVMTDRVALARTELVWPTVPRGDADEKALDVLADVLGGLDKENRLFLALMYDKQIAAKVEASNPSQALSGGFHVTLTAKPKQDLDELIKIADAQIDRLKQEGPTEAEVRKAKTADESRLIFGLQAIGRKADFLNGYNVHFDDPRAYKKEMQDLFAVTTDDVKRVANKYLKGHRVRLDVNPGPPTPRAPEVEVDRSSQAAVKNPEIPPIKDSFDRSVMPKPGPNPKFTPPSIARRKLSNGLEVLVAERHQLPILSLYLVVKGGETLAPEGQGGLASMTADLLTEGTESRNSLKLAGELAEVGATLDARGELEASGLTLTTLTNQAEKAMDLFSDVLLHPSFPAKELDRLRAQRLSTLMARNDNPMEVSRLAFRRALYGSGHPYGQPDLGTPQSIKGITRDDVAAFHKRIYMPNNAALIVVGDTTPDAMTATLESALKDWKPGKAPEAKLPDLPKPAEGVTFYVIDKPAAAQSVLRAGLVGPPRSTSDYFALSVMNAILGGQFSSRINLNLREDKGYTYGARSMFDFRQGPGPFVAVTPVQTAVTKPALVELMKELSDITGPRPATDQELSFAKDNLVKSFPGRFETTQGVATALSEIVLYNLPDDELATYQSKIEAITGSDVARVAKKYLDPNRMMILVVGDRAKIEPQLKTFPGAKVINALDPEGNPATEGADKEKGGGTQ